MGPNTRRMSPLPATQRFTTPLWRCNGFNSDPFRKKAPKAKRTPKPAKAKEFKALSRPVLHVHADGKRKGVMVVPKEIAEKCGSDATTIMGMISTHAPTFQLEKKTIAGMCGLSQERAKCAIQLLCQHGYAHYLPWRAGKRNRGWVLQTNANGNIQRMTGSILHYSLEDGAAATAERPQRRQTMRRKSAGLTARTRRETGDDSLQTLGASLSYSEVGGSEDPPLASPIMLTPLKKEIKPQTPLADAERGSSSFLVLVDGSPLTPAIEGEAQERTVVEQLILALDSPEAKAKYPLTPEQEDSLDIYLGQELSRQLEANQAERAEIAEGAAIADLPVVEETLTVEFSTDTFELWRRCMHTWEDGDLEKPWEMQAALDLHRAAPTTDNLIARAMLAPQLFNRSSYAPHAGRSVFHLGYRKFAAATVELHRGDEAELGLIQMPRPLTQGDNALLWMQTHRVGLVFLASVKNPEALTAIQAAKLVRKLRKGTVTMRHIFRLWLLAHYGNKMLTVEEACEVLRMKFGMELRSMDDIEGYRLALRRMRDANRGVTPKSAEDRFDFSFEFDDAYDLDGCMREGKQLLEKYTQAMRAHQNVEAALLAVRATGATSAEDSERLAHMWLQAQIDQNEDVLQQLKSWGAVEHLRDWTTKKAAGRQWLSSVGRQWNFTHLPEIAQTLGWASYTEWWMLNELRHYAMRKAWDAFVDVQGGAHSIWSNSLLDRKN